MNKQEAIRILEDESWEYENYFRTIHAVDLDDARKIISQIDEPQKVTVPKFVAEWIEAAKETHNNLSWVWFSRPTEIKTQKWLNCNTEKFMRAYMDGFEIEQEKLYTVEIPDPHGLYKIRYLFRNSAGNIRIGGTDYRDIFSEVETHLTESEIKQDFEWAFQFAKEVEE